MTTEGKEQQVLVIEDDDNVRKFAVRVLELEGYAVVSAADGAEGLRLARTHGISLVLLDLQLPGATGWEVLEELRKEPEMANVPVLLFTAASGPEVREKAARAGVTGFLAKPLTAGDLRKSVASVIGSQK